MENKTLISKLVKIMAAVEKIPKNGYNGFHKYHYATESDVCEHVRGLMVEHNIILIPNVKKTEMIREDIVCIETEYTYHDGDSGESLSFMLPSHGQDKNDKSVYKALTGGMKYALMKTLQIPTGDDPERHDGGNDKKSAQGGKGSSQGGYKFTSDKQIQAICAICTKAEIDLNQFKLYLLDRGQIGLDDDGQLTMKKLTAKFASKILDKADEAIEGFKKWQTGLDKGQAKDDSEMNQFQQVSLERLEKETKAIQNISISAELLKYKNSSSRNLKDVLMLEHFEAWEQTIKNRMNEIGSKNGQGSLL